MKRLIRLLALDMDGTILDEGGVLPPRRAELLRELADEGIRITFVTGRMFRSAVRYGEMVPLGAPLVAYNGAMIVDLMGVMWYHDPIPEEETRRVLGFFRDWGVYVQAYNREELWVEEATSPASRYYARLSGVEPTQVGDDLYRGGFASTKILAVEEDPKRMEELIREARSSFPSLDFYTSKGQFLEVMLKGVNKGRSLEMLIYFLGIQKDQVLVMGDGDNDSHMLSSFPNSVAVAGASDLAKRSARFVVPQGAEPVEWIRDNVICGAEPCRCGG
ncbi:Cof-type HAD-IIB family hydrolase [Thermanaerovibrio acidaminovorans]|uniref:Cof-type HAD-IIB family hydrolase n=1 Tax=Thermanaerovibrio acidaminovorans TaxID=81462 RepID=UPI0003041521